MKEKHPTDTVSLQSLIKTFDLPLDPASVNMTLERIGILEKVYYQSTTGSGATKSFIALTTAGLKYGVNLGTMHEFRTEPRYFEDTFPELMTLVVKQIAADVEAIKRVVH